jgi:hypothetical protein
MARAEWVREAGPALSAGGGGTRTAPGPLHSAAAASPVVGVLDETKRAQRSSHTGPPGYIGWTRFQPMYCRLAGLYGYSAGAGLADYKIRLKLPPLKTPRNLSANNVRKMFQKTTCMFRKISKISFKILIARKFTFLLRKRQEISWIAIFLFKKIKKFRKFSVNNSKSQYKL